MAVEYVWLREALYSIVQKGGDNDGMKMFVCTHKPVCVVGAWICVVR